MKNSYQNYSKDQLVDLIEELKEQKRLLEESQEITKSGGWEYNVSEKKIYWTPQVYNIYGLNGDDNIDVSIDYAMSFYCEEGKKKLEKAFKNAIEKSEPYDLEVKLKNVKGEVIWIRTIGKTEKNDGKVSRIYGNIIDITERKVYENTIERVSNNLKRLIDISQELSSDLDLQNLLQNIVDQALEIEALDTGAIYLINGNFVKLSATSPPLPKDMPDSIKYDSLDDHPHIKKSIDTRASLIIHDTSKAELSKSERIICESRGLKTILYLPIIAKNRPVGILILGTLNNLHNFSAEELDQYNTFSNIAGMALQNSILFEQVSSNEKRLSTAQEIAKLGDFVWHINDDKVHLSDHLYKIIELEPTEGMTLDQINRQIHHPDDIERINSSLSNAIANFKSELEPLEYRLITKSGKFLDVRTVAKIEYENNLPVRVFGAVQDITQQKELQNEIALVNKALENSLNGFDIVDHEGKFIYANKAYLDMWGYESIDELIGKSPANHCVDPDIPKIIIDTLKQNGSCEIEFEGRKKDGSTFYVQMYAILEYDSHGNEIYTGTSLDITERKLNEKRLKERNEFIETIIDNLPIGLAVNTINDGKAQYMNKKFESIYGWPQKDINNVIDFFKHVYPDPKYREEISSRIMADLESKKPDRMNWEDIYITRKDGERRIIAAKNIPLPDQNLMISTVQDETEKKNALKNFIKAQERYKILFENQPTLIWLMNYSKVKEAFDNLKQKGINNFKEYFNSNEDEVTRLADLVRIVEINQSSIEILEAESKFQVLEKSISYYFRSAEGWDVFKDFLINMATGAQNYENDLPIITFKGNKKYLRIKIIISSEHEKISKQTILTALDITEQKKYIDQLKKSREQIRAMFANLDKILEDERKMLARELHDELGQVLTSIRMNLSLMKNTIKTSEYDAAYLENEIDEIQQILDDSNRTMKSLIQYLRPEYLDNLGLIIALEHLVEEIQHKSKIKIEFNNNIENITLPPQIENTVFRVIQEAFTNIVKHSKADNVTLSLLLDNNNLNVQVTDNGIGIGKKDLDRINSFGILGMRERLNNIKSRLKLESNLGKGTKLSFNINL